MSVTSSRAPLPPICAAAVPLNGRDERAAEGSQEMTTRSKVIVLVLVSCLAVTFVPAAFGQAESGTVAGTVTDTTSAVVAGAAVSIKDVATGTERTATTNNLGAYTIPGLTLGNYDVTITK